MAREYGMLPSEILGERNLPTGTRFHLDYDIYAATARHIEEQREQKREEMDPSSSRVGSIHERKQMARNKEELAEQRESMEQAGMKAPSPDGQMSKLESLKEKRAEARQMQSKTPDTVGDLDG